MMETVREKRRLYKYGSQVKGKGSMALTIPSWFMRVAGKATNCLVEYDLPNKKLIVQLLDE